MFRLFLREKIKSASSSKGAGAKRDEGTPTRRNRRAYERFTVDHKHLTMMNEQDILVIKDISAKGFSSRVSERTYQRLEIGDVFAARIRYLGEIYDLQAKVSWKSDDVVGFELERAERRAIDFMSRIIRPIALARSLLKVDSNFMRDNTEGKIWYHGDDDSDLYLWQEQSGELRAWQLINSDRFIDWEFARGIRTGRLTIVDEAVSSVLDVTQKALKQIIDPKPDVATKQFFTDVIMAMDLPEKDTVIATLME